MFAIKKDNTNLQDLFLISSQKLKNAGVERPELDARILIAHALSTSEEDVIRKSKEFIFADEERKIEKLIEQRKAREPVAKIIGKKEFYGREFITTRATLDPRPETELIIEAALSLYSDKNIKINIADFGTGTGILPITLLKEFKYAEAIAVDISEEALIVASENSRKHSVFERIKFVQADWREENFSKNFNKKFDLIVTNPPYIKQADLEILSPETRFDPELALIGGFDGLECYRFLMPAFKEIIADTGFIIAEIGQGQEKQVEEIADKSGLKIKEIRNDLANIARCLIIENNA